MPQLIADERDAKGQSAGENCAALTRGTFAHLTS